LAGFKSHGLINRLQLDTNQRISFYECRGKPLIISAAFVNSKPWLLPIDIQSLSSSEILNLKPFLTVYGFLYQLAGCSLNSGNHFMAVIFWYGKKFYYDGMQSKGCRVIRTICGKPIKQQDRVLCIFNYLLLLLVVPKESKAYNTTHKILNLQSYQ